jgi:hypothetical protein
MPNVPVGFERLKQLYKLPHRLTHCSFIGNNSAIEMTSSGSIEQVYGPRYAPKTDSPYAHIEFGLKYDDLNLDFLQAVFRQLNPEELIAWIQTSPGGKYNRKVGFLYEMLTGNQLNLTRPATGNYVDLMEPDKYITGSIRQNVKWKINDNFTGTTNYCPIVRKTPKLTRLLEVDTVAKIRQLQENYPEDVFQRAARYLYNKETRSSYEIEKEVPTADRMEKFVSLLMRAGKEQPQEMLSRTRLVQLQNAIVDPRFAAADFRDFQNYIGETLPNYQEILHYICPPPGITPSLMTGLSETLLKTDEADSIIRATLIAFGFVFIHPFEDGNGRLHRFLIHDLLVRDELVPSGIVIPVSAHMLANIKAYDNILEKYSVPLMQRVKYNKNNAGEIMITNATEVEGYFRYPDLTDQCIYLLETIHATIDEDMPEEITFLLRYDEARKAMQRIVDMPDKMINQMLIFLHQNKGTLPKRRRETFAKLTDQEIALMESAYQEIYDLQKQ